MSAPAARAFSLPKTTTAFTDGSAARSAAASPIAPSNAFESGFIAPALSRSATTPSGCGSRRTSSSAMGPTLEGGAFRGVEQLTSCGVWIEFATGDRGEEFLEVVPAARAGRLLGQPGHDDRAQLLTH